MLLRNGDLNLFILKNYLPKATLSFAPNVA